MYIHYTQSNTLFFLGGVLISKVLVLVIVLGIKYLYLTYVQSTLLVLEGLCTCT